MYAYLAKKTKSLSFFSIFNRRLLRACCLYIYMPRNGSQPPSLEGITPPPNWLFSGQEIANSRRLAQFETKIQANPRFALFAFFVTPVSPLANGKRPYPTNSTGRPIGCDSAHDGQMQISRSYSFWETQTKLFYRICYLGTACAATTSIIPPTLKQVHSRISVTGGAFFRATKGAGQTLSFSW